MARSKWGSDDPRRAALAERNRNRLWTPEMRTKISCSSRGRAGNRLGIPHSEEAKQKMSRGQIKAWRSSERRIALSKRLLGNTHTLGFRHSEETKKRMGDAHRGMKYRPWSQEACERQRQRFLGKKHSEESKAKMSKTRKGKPLSEKNRAGIKKAWNTPKLRALASIQSKRRWSREGERERQAIVAAKTNRHIHLISPTSLELKLANLLEEFPCVQREVRFGRFVVDAYLPPPYHLAFEADGAYWHDQETDRKRDAWLAEHYGLPVVRLSEGDLKWPAQTR